MDTKRLKIYRKFQEIIFKYIFSTKKIFPENLPYPLGPKRIWFHASSAGELESLWSLIQEALKSSVSVLVTVWSESALSSLEKLKKELGAEKFLYTGYSPREGQWAKALRKIEPALFVTAKYEAWPELWVGLSELKTPLVITSARDRPSLRAAKIITGLLGYKLPSMWLFTVYKEDRAALGTLFPSAKIEVSGDPRWDRIYERAVVGNPRARELIDIFSKLPKPWGVLGQVWKEDLYTWKDILTQTSQVFWVVPHKTDRENLNKIEMILKSTGKKILKTSEILGLSKNLDSGPELPVILVNEIGFLSELYSCAAWAYVGGGFSSGGIHNTMEPAIWGIPLSVGPKGVEKFSEIKALQSSGQLTVLKTPTDLARWFCGLQGLSTEKQAGWKKDLSALRGATEKMVGSGLFGEV